MTKTLIALAAAGMLASPILSAQPYHREQPQRWSQDDRWDDRSAGINEREARINARIQRGIDDGRINEREARLNTARGSELARSGEQTKGPAAPRGLRAVARAKRRAANPHRTDRHFHAPRLDWA